MSTLLSTLTDKKVLATAGKTALVLMVVPALLGAQLLFGGPGGVRWKQPGETGATRAASRASAAVRARAATDTTRTATARRQGRTQSEPRKDTGEVHAARYVALSRAGHHVQSRTSRPVRRPSATRRTTARDDGDLDQGRAAKKDKRDGRGSGGDGSGEPGEPGDPEPSDPPDEPERPEEPEEPDDPERPNPPDDEPPEPEEPPASD